MKKKIIIPIIIVVVVALLIIGALVLFFTNKGFYGTWINTIRYKDEIIEKTIEFKRNGKVIYTIKNKSASEKTIKEGTWKEENDYISIEFESADGINESFIYITEDNTFCIDDECEDYQMFSKKTLFSKEVQYVINDEYEDENEGEYEDEENIDTDLDTMIDGEVAIYLFRGEGCPHCSEAEEWFESLEEEYGDLFTVVDYETWYDTDNERLMRAVAKSRGDNASGVPYIIIGDKSWKGFAGSYKQEMLDTIKSLASKE